MMKTKTILQIFLLLFFFLGSCRKSTEMPRPKITKLPEKIIFKRFDRDLFSLAKIDKSAFIQGANELAVQYPVFYPFYFEDYLAIYNPTSTDSMARLDSVRAFITDPFIDTLRMEAEKQFPDLSFCEAEVNEALAYGRYYFPTYPLPQLVSLIGALGPAAFTVDTSVLALNLDMYLGPDKPYYSHASYPRYTARRFRKEYMSTNLMKVWAQNLLPPAQENTRLLDEICYQGRVLFLTDMVLPDKPDSLKIGFSAQQLQWCADNEREIWTYFLDQKLLYNHDRMKYMRYVSDGPTTNGMPAESPGNTGSWLGWQIVRKAMLLHTPEEWPDLLQIRDGQKWLEMAKYKPRRK